MLVKKITSIKDDMVKTIRSLRRASERQAQGLGLLTEGADKYLQALADSAYDVSFIVVEETMLEHYRERVIDYALCDRIYTVSAGIMQKLTASSKHCDFCAVVKFPAFSADDMKLKSSILVLDDIVNDANIGSICRSAKAFGVDAIFLSGTNLAEIFTPTSMRASVGTVLQLPIVSLAFDDIVAFARENEFRLIATTPHCEMSLREFQFPHKSMLVLGNETTGLSEETIQACDLQLSIPLTSEVESLNVSVAAGVMLFHWQV